LWQQRVADYLLTAGMLVAVAGWLLFAGSKAVRGSSEAVRLSIIKSDSHDYFGSFQGF